MLFNREAVNKREEEDYENNKELNEEDYIQINEDISKALFEMKKEKEKEEEEEDSNESFEENEKELDNFDIDFFSESSNSISMDLRDENSVKSANVEMDRQNLTLDSSNKSHSNSNNNKNSSNKTINNKINESDNKKKKNDKKSSSNTSLEGITKPSLNNDFKKKSSFNSMKNERRNGGLNSNKEEHSNNSFNNSPFSNYNNKNSNYLNKCLYINNNIKGGPNNIDLKKKILNNCVNTNKNNFTNFNINNFNIKEKVPHFVNNNMNNMYNNLSNNNNNIDNLNCNLNLFKRYLNNENILANNNVYKNSVSNINIMNNNNFLNNNKLNNMNISNCNNANNISNFNMNINNLNQNYNFIMMSKNNNNCINNLNNINNNNNILNNINNINNNSNILNNINNINNNNFYNGSVSEGNSQINKNVDSPKNIIHIENILKSKDKRTTLIIRNIPNRYTISLLLNEINKNYYRKYDVVYLPQDYINNSNLGFGFINFLEHMYLIMFYEEFVGKKWDCFNSNKRCQLAYSKCQGKNELTKYIHKKLGISSHYNNNENLKKSFYINNEDKYPRPIIEIPLKYYKSFISYYPYSLCHIKDDRIFVVDKYYNF